MTAFSSSSPSSRVASITRVVPPLVELVGECGGVTAKKALVVLGSLATILKGREAVVATSGITVLMEATKTGPTTGREFVVHVLLQLATESPHIQGLLVGEGAIPLLVALRNCFVSGDAAGLLAGTTVLELIRTGGNREKIIWVRSLEVDLEKQKVVVVGDNITPFEVLISGSRFIVALATELRQQAPSVSILRQSLSSRRWIVDAGSGKRVKLACVNWPSHLEPMVAEGLSKRPLDEISKAIGTMGFNCVRFTWPTFLATNHSLANLTVRQSFERLSALNSTDISLIERHNPALIDLPLIEAYQAVVSNLGDNNVMVILDNHISKPGWCCKKTDGNGFFGDTYFDPNVWLEGLHNMATLFRSHKNVIGMSLRNELRGPRQNVEDWFKYMEMGAEAVHAANNDVLVILSGLSFDIDLGFLSTRQVKVSFSSKSKLVFEVHWYSFSDGQAWGNGNPNDVCGRISGSVTNKAGFLLDRQFPLFLSEFGIDQRGVNERDNRYFSCALAYAADKDLDWALWTLQGSYYLREGVVELEETYGLLSLNWATVRNPTQLQRVRAIQQPFRGPGFSDVPPYKIIFHPLTGHCVTLDSSRRLTLAIGPCSQRWNFNDDQTLSLTTGSTSSCITAVGLGMPVALAECHRVTSSKWALLSSSHMHVSTKVAGGNATVCLDVGRDGRSLITNPCRCLGGDARCDPEGQWFKLVTSSRLIN
ncbi:hypothetical protein ZIOFF_066441 [Zingiber officinale]|uniref:Glycoside hydrolase family 5 domain-containing protein n=2 Tax=Zingiber officinale TaxID=94328 RepID=A0A8J5EYD0_ZINOF|nr:hypothetical protein ZIOFF_066441 [Zingiber officinale]